MAASDELTSVASLDFLYVCDHAFVDSEYKPCLIGIVERLVPRTDFPIWYSKLTVAIGLRAEPNSQFLVKVQFGPAGDMMRNGQFTAIMPPWGTLLVPFNMVQLRFDEPGDYEARVIVDDVVLLPVRTIKVLAKPVAAAGS